MLFLLFLLTCVAAETGRLILFNQHGVPKFYAGVTENTKFEEIQKILSRVDYYEEISISFVGVELLCRKQ